MNGSDQNRRPTEFIWSKSPQEIPPQYQGFHSDERDPRFEFNAPKWYDFSKEPVIPGSENWFRSSGGFSPSSGFSPSPVRLAQNIHSPISPEYSNPSVKHPTPAPRHVHNPISPGDSFPSAINPPSPSLPKDHKSTRVPFVENPAPSMKLRNGKILATQNAQKKRSPVNRVRDYSTRSTNMKVQRSRQNAVAKITKGSKASTTTAPVKQASSTNRVVKPAPVSRPLRLNNQKKKAAVAKLTKENKNERLRNGLAVIKASKEGLAPLKEEGSKANNIPAAPITKGSKASTTTAPVKQASFTKRVVKPAPVSRPLQLNNQKKNAKNDAVAKLTKENKDGRLRNGLAVIKASKEALVPLKEEGSKANNIPAAPIPPSRPRPRPQNSRPPPSRPPIIARGRKQVTIPKPFKFHSSNRPRQALPEKSPFVPLALRVQQFLKTPKKDRVVRRNARGRK
ncbi:7184_t:CDS:2 [Paraglomus brasilianum]|uniref:7184_t:CDS:1 n=1 Tax=Paraglomus brasilianum TaxID=144538 RepID=A0A9N9C758_9GLOM|nr:7184_t:CDS:2 [Paraglomus brasilianum]